MIGSFKINKDDERFFGNEPDKSVIEYFWRLGTYFFKMKVIFLLVLFIFFILHVKASHKLQEYQKIVNMKLFHYNQEFCHCQYQKLLQKS